MRVALFVMALAVLCASASAADHDAAYYKRTGTKPPAEVAPYIALSAGYDDGGTVGIGGGVLFKKSDILLLGQFTFSNVQGGYHATTPFAAGCQTYQVPYYVPSSGGTAFAITVALPLGGKK